jgi:hypothetical protein
MSLLSENNVYFTTDSLYKHIHWWLQRVYVEQTGLVRDAWHPQIQAKQQFWRTILFNPFYCLTVVNCCIICHNN